MKSDKIEKNVIYFLVFYIAEAAAAFLVYYIALPPINPHSTGFWIYLAFLLLLAVAPIMFMFGKRPGKIMVFLEDVYRKSVGQPRTYRSKSNRIQEKKQIKWTSYLIWLPVIPIVVLIVGTFISSTVFNAKSYAAVIDVTEAEFGADMPQSTEVTNIALMDSDTAKIIGNRTLGSLSEVVSQYEISEEYTQINYRRTPQKVANLEYAGFFKWFGNKNSGIPGYVMVDPVNNTAVYRELETPLKYVESGYFGDDLMRKLRFSYPTKILGEPRFEIDDEGNPVFIVPCYKPKILLFGANDVNEVIIFDPCTGNSEILGVQDTPAWIDIVYDGNLAVQKYNWKGLLSGGFINSIIGNKDCKQTTDDFGYIVIEDDVWYYTGVTSVNNDKSNIGFIVSNARTGEYKFYPVIGAEEHSAMAAAEGEVQEKGYVASFPALINVSGQATYIMVLKDAGGLVKLYALVNVEQYSIVATGETQQKAMKEYRRLLAENGIIGSGEDTPPDESTSFDAVITVTDIRIVTYSGESYIYLSALYGEQNCVFKKAVAEDESLMLIRPGDTISVNASETGTERIYSINSWE